jgi:ribonuclease HII
LINNNKVILGIDEAGRGAAVGPMVMYGVLVYPGQEQFMQGLGVKDSKELDPESREKKAKLIKQILGHYHFISDYKEIDQYVFQKKLNELERKIAQNIIYDLVDTFHIPIGTILLDGHNMFDPLKEKLGKIHPEIEVIVEDHADSKYLSVAAASILAKTERDWYVHELMGKKIQGGGYCNEHTAHWIHTQYKIWKQMQFEEEKILESLQIRQSFSWCDKLIKEIKK